MVRFYVVELRSEVTCNSCHEIEKMWFRLADQWANHSFALLADVRCGWDGDEYNNKLCTEHKIGKMLQFKHGDPLALEPIRWYDWDQVNYDTLSEFAYSYLSKPICSFHQESLTHCKRKELLQLRKFLSSPEEELEKAIALEEKKMSRLDDVESEVDNIKMASAEIYDSYVIQKNDISEEVRIIEAVVRFSLDKILNKLQSTSEEDAVQLCSIVSKEGLRECEPTAMQTLIETIQNMSEQDMNEVMRQQMARLHSVHSYINAQIDVLLSTSEKLRRDLVEEAEYIFHSAKVEGYYFMKGAYKKKMLIKNGGCCED